MRIERGGFPILRIVLITVAALAMVSSAGFGYWYITRDTNPIPASIRQKLTFSPFIMPENSQGRTTSDHRLVTADDGTELFIYTIHMPDGNQVTVSQYIQPSQFTDIPEYRDRFLSNVAKQYETVPTASGTVYLGRLTKQNDEQVGIMLEKGVIVFLKPDKELDSTAWRHIAEALEIHKL